MDSSSHNLTNTGPSPAATLESVRRAALNRSFGPLAIVGGVGFLAGSISEAHAGRYTAVLLYTFLFIVCVTIALAGKLDFRIRAWTMILAFFALSISELYMYGVASMADAFFVIATVYAAMFFPRRTALAVIAIGLSITLAFSALYLSGAIPVLNPQQEPSAYPTAWGGQIGIQCFICFVVYFLMGDFSAALQQSLQAEKQNVAELQRQAAEHEKTEHALRESEERYRSLFGASDSGVLLMRNNVIVDCNPRALTLFGGTREEILRSPPGTFGPPRQADGQNTEVKALGIISATLSEGPQSFLWRFRRLDASEFDAECVLAALPIRGTPHLLAIIRDITERLHAAEEQEKLRTQLAQAQKLESIGRLAGGIAHDFNNLLAVIMGFSESGMQDLPPESPVYTTFQEIHAAATRSAALTRQLLAFARRQSAEPRVLDLNESVGATCTILQRLIGENIELRWNPGRDTWPTLMDPAQLDQVLTNLVVNARDAVLAVPPGTGVIAISTFNATVTPDDDTFPAEQQPGDYAVLCVTDSGAGMSKEVLEHIFEPFYSTKPLGQGTGLGLATVYGIVKQNGGFVVVYSEPSHGTAFKLYLPRTAQQSTRYSPPHQTTVLRRGTETILLVEDEESILQLTAKMLKRDGYTVLTARSPLDALAISESYEHAIDVLLTDVVMPDMHGRMLRDKLVPQHPSMRTLFMSGYTADVIAQHGVLDAGVHFIEKPFAYKSLFAKLREVLDS